MSGWVVVLSSLQILYIFKYDASNEMLLLRHTIHSTMDFDKDTGLLMPDPVDYSPAAKQGGKIVTVSLFCGHISLENAEVTSDVSSNLHPNDLKILPSDDSLKIRKREEEEYFYGETLPENITDNDMSNEVTSTSAHNTPEAKKASASDAIMSHMNVLENDDAPDSCIEGNLMSNGPKISSKSYVMVADRSGRVSCIHLSTEECTEFHDNDNQMEIEAEENNSTVPRKLFQSIPLGTLADRIDATIDEHPIHPDNSNAPPLPQPRRFVTGVSLALIGTDTAEGPNAVDERMCLVVVLNTGDIVVYTAVTSASGDLKFFHKLGHSLITRRKKSRAVARLKRRNRLGGSGDQYLDLDSVMTSQAMLSMVKDSAGQLAVMISGARPLIVCNMRGMIQVVPLRLPELPYAGVGIHFSSYFSIGSTRGFAVLWREEKIEGGSIGNDMGNSMTSLSTLGLYTMTEGTLQFPGSDISVLRTSVGRTTHKICEFTQNKTDDSTQQALLKTKTFVMYCSEKVPKQWSGDVLTDIERADDEGTYARFFKKMQSYCEPSSSFGPPPVLEEDLYCISIMQNDGVVVDKYPLPLGERVLDMTIVYLTVEVAEATISNTAPTKKKKAFVAVCTEIDDRHGEDTQGEGRLLLFALDYALYDEDQKGQDDVDEEKASTSGTTDTAESKEQNEIEDNGDSEVTHDEVKIEKTEVSAVSSGIEVDATLTASVTAVTSVATTVPATTVTSSAQARFLGAIKPKLRLLWTGPGPGSVVVPFKDNYLLATVGATLYLYEFNVDTKELEQVAFCFTQFYISTISVMKDYILIGDACQSVQFVAWRHEDMSLTLLAKDYDLSACTSANYVLDGDTMGFVISDDEANLRLMRFNPK